MVNVNDEQDYTATVGSETAILNKTADKHYDFEIDCSVLQTGESLEIRLKKKIRAGGTLLTKEYSQVTFAMTTAGGGKTDLYAYNWEPSSTELEITGKQIGGTARVFKWRLYDS